MKKLLLVTLLTILLSIAAMGCTNHSSNGTSTEKGLKITGISSSLGGTESNLNVQEFSYTITVENQSSKAMDIEWMEPVIIENIKSRMIGQPQLRKLIDAELKKGETVTLDGKLEFDSADLTKKEILGFQIIFGIHAKVGEQIVFFN